MKLVFVYGTLKRGFGNHQHHLAGAEFLGRAETVLPNFVMKDTGGFPVVFHANDLKSQEIPAKVSGEVYSVQDEHIRRMDRLESNGMMFVRVPVTVELDDASQATAEVYLGVPAYWDDIIARLETAPRVNDVYSWRT